MLLHTDNRLTGDATHSFSQNSKFDDDFVDEKDKALRDEFIELLNRATKPNSLRGDVDSLTAALAAESVVTQRVSQPVVEQPVRVATRPQQVEKSVSLDTSDKQSIVQSKVVIPNAANDTTEVITVANAQASDATAVVESAEPIVATTPVATSQLMSSEATAANVSTTPLTVSAPVDTSTVQLASEDAEVAPEEVLNTPVEGEGDATQQPLLKSTQGQSEEGNKSRPLSEQKVQNPAILHGKPELKQGATPELQVAATGEQQVIAPVLETQESFSVETNDLTLATQLQHRLSAQLTVQQFLAASNAVPQRSAVNITMGLLKETFQSMHSSIHDIDGAGRAAGSGAAGGSNNHSDLKQNSFSGFSAERQSVSGEQGRGNQAAPLPRNTTLRTMERIDAALREAAKSRDGKTLSFKLDPDNLGRVKVDVSIRDGHLHARITPDSAQVSALIREQAHDLQGSLRKLGLNVDSVTVSVGSDSEGSQTRSDTLANDGSSSGNSFQQERNKLPGEERQVLGNTIGNELAELGESVRDGEIAASSRNLINGAGGAIKDHWVA